MRLLFVFSIIALLSIQARADYPSALPNANIHDEVANEKDRLIPTTEHFAFADDTDVFYRGLGDHDFYHGAGFWMQLRSEAVLNPILRLNVRSIFFDATNDAGYTAASGNYHLFAATITAPDTILGGHLSLRGPDLDRQTFGAGLMIQDKEMNGALVRWDNGRTSVILRADDTGLLRQGDDTYNVEVSFLGGFIGAGGVLWPQGIEQDHLTHERDSYGYLFSHQKFSWIEYAFEAGERAGARAGLASLGSETNWAIGSTSLKVNVKAEYRRYEAGFAKDFAGQIQNQYISYDQYNKDFTNASNVFVYGDDANVLAGHLDLAWTLSHAWRLETFNEVGQFAYGARSTVPYYFFRHEVDWLPLEGREESLNFFFSNKVLTDSFTQPPGQVSLANAPLFSMFPFVGVEIRARF